MTDTAERPHTLSSVHEFDSVIRGAREGAEWAWRHLYDGLVPQMLGYLRVQGAAEPEDLVGETFLQLARHIKTFDGDESGFRSWAFTIAHNRLIDERRAKLRRPVTPTADAWEAIGGDVEEEGVRAATTAEIKAILDRLPELQRDVLVLRIVGGFTIDEIATTLRKTSGSVKALQRRGLSRLEKLLG
jgi:RNA polymerase sigma-70 factor (ECF subfamily)